MSRSEAVTNVVYMEEAKLPIPFAIPQRFPFLQKETLNKYTLSFCPSSVPLPFLFRNERHCVLLPSFFIPFSSLFLSFFIPLSFPFSFLFPPRSFLLLSSFFPRFPFPLTFLSRSFASPLAFLLFSSYDYVPFPFFSFSLPVLPLLFRTQICSSPSIFVSTKPCL